MIKKLIEKIKSILGRKPAEIVPVEVKVDD